MLKLCINKSDSIVLCTIIIVLILARLNNFLTFHVLAELFSICIAFTLFLVGWSSRKLIQNNVFTFISISCFYVGFTDVLHLISFKGMNLITGVSTNEAAQTWMISRFLQTALFLYLALATKKFFNDTILFVVYFFLTLVLLFTVFIIPIFPNCFIEGSGVTPLDRKSVV